MQVINRPEKNHPKSYFFEYFCARFRGDENVDFLHKRPGPVAQLAPCLPAGREHQPSKLGVIGSMVDY